MDLYPKRFGKVCLSHCLLSQYALKSTESVPFIFQYLAGRILSKLVTVTAVGFTAESLQTYPSEILTAIK